MRRMNRILSASLLSFALVALAPAAFADVVFPEPASCPEGGQPATCHGGPHCRALTCTTNTDCQGGLVCQERSFCVNVINCAGLLPPDADPSMFDVQTVESTCSANDSCDAGSCTALKVCVPADSMSSSGSSSVSSGGGSGNPPGNTGTESSCDCRLGASHERFGALALAFGTLASLAFRRRRQR